MHIEPHEACPSRLPTPRADTDADAMEPSLPIIDEIASIFPSNVKMTYAKTQKPS